MQTITQPSLEYEINGCMVTLSFAEKPRDGVMEKIYSRFYQMHMMNGCRKT